MASRGGDSKQGLIITLVIFVLLTITLGVVAWLGYSDQQRLVDEAKKARDGEKAAKSARDWEQFKELVFKVYSGHGSKDDLVNLADKRAQFVSGSGPGQGEKDREEFSGILKVLDTEKMPDGKEPLLGWSEVEKRPAHTYKSRVDDLRAKLKEALTDRAALNNQVKTAEQHLANVEKDHQAEVRKLKEELAAKEKAVLELRAAKDKAFDDLRAQFEGLSVGKRELELKAASDQEDLERKRAKLEAERDDLTKKIKRIEDQIRPINYLDFDTPKGQVVRVDRDGRTAWINLGSADRVQPGLTFSFTGQAAPGKSDRDFKGKLEVARVLDEHLAMVRVTELKDPLRKPLLERDLLFNPSWSPNKREHVAVAGVIDLTGNGSDNTAEFIRNLEKMGMVVDEYVDQPLANPTIQGKGMSLQTSYLIVGDVPQPQLREGSSKGIGKADARTERQVELAGKVQEMQAKAHRLGVSVVSLRRFADQVGYRLPRGAQSAEPSYRPALPGSPSPLKEASPKEEKPADTPKEEKPKEDKGK